MFSGQVYDQIKDQLNYFLFGFDKSQLQCSILNGIINLDNCNLRPNRAEQILDGMGIPFSLRAGMIGRLELKLNLLQGAMKFLSSSDNQTINVKLSDVYFILGPQLKHNSHDDSFIEETEAEMAEPYDENNCFNIFTNNLKLRKKRKPQSAAQQQVEEMPMPKEVREMLANLNITVERLHIRYEDDYFSEGAPYSFGVIIDQLHCETGKFKEILGSISQYKPSKQDFDDYMHRSGLKKTGIVNLLKDISINGFRFYWNCLSEMFIPTSLWEQTKDLRFQIFEALDADHLIGLMKQAFGDQKHRELFQQVVDKCDINMQVMIAETEAQDDMSNIKLLGDESKPQDLFRVVQLHVHTTPIRVRINPQIMNDIAHFNAQQATMSIIKDLKQYRPNRRPMTNVPDRIAQKYAVKRKRRLIVRDWFFFIVWYIRLKKILRGVYSKETVSNFLLFSPRYSSLLEAFLADPNMPPNQLKEIIQKQEEQIKDKSINLKFRFESICFGLHKNQLTSCASLEVASQKIALDISNKEKTGKEDFQDFKARVDSLNIYTYHQKNEQDTRRPKELKSITFKQHIEVQEVMTPTANTFSKAPLPPNQKTYARQRADYAMQQPVQATLNTNKPLAKKFATDQLRTPRYVDTEHEQEIETMDKKHLPNITSPSRLMIDRIKQEPGLNRHQKHFDDFDISPTTESVLGDSKRKRPSVMKMQDKADFKRKGSTNSLVGNLVDSVMNFPSKFLQSSNMGTQPTEAADMQRQGFVVTTRKNSTTVINNTAIHALQSVRVQPNVNYQGLKGRPGNAGDRRLQQDFDSRKMAARKDDPKKIYVQDNQVATMASKRDKSSSGLQVSQLNIDKQMTSSNNMIHIRHNFVQSQLGNGGDSYDFELDQIQISAGSCEADEPLNTTMSKSNRIGPHEGIQNKNCASNLRDKESKQNLLGKLLNKPASNKNRSGMNTKDEKSTTTTTQSFVHNECIPTGPYRKEQAMIKQQTQISQRVQTKNDTTLNTLPYVIVKHSEKGARVTIQTYRQQLLHITQQNDCCIQFSHEVQMNSSGTQVKSQTDLGHVHISYSAAVVKNLFDFLAALKDAKIHPGYRDFNLQDIGIHKLTDTLLPQHHLRFGSQSLQAQLDSQMLRYLATLAPPLKQDGMTNLNFVDAEMKSAKFDFRVDGGRIYVSLFEQESRDHIARFVSPPLSITLQKCQDEFNCDLFGFMYQQTASLAALHTFVNNLHTHVSMFAQNPAIKSGHQFYEKMLQEYKNKIDDKQRLAQKAIAQAKLQNVINRNALSGNQSPRTGDDFKERGSSQRQSFQIQNEFQFQQFKNKLKAHQIKADSIKKSPNKNSMVSSNLLLQELVSKKGDINTLEDIVADQTESESNIDGQRNPVETEPAKLINGDQDDVIDEQERQETHGNSDGTPRVKGKKKHSMIGNAEMNKNLGQPVLKNVDGRITLTFTQITTSITDAAQIRVSQQPGEIYMNFEKEERKLPQKPTNVNGARPSQKKGNMQNLFKKALQVKSGRVSLSSASLKRRLHNNDQDEPQQDADDTTQRDHWECDERLIPSAGEEEDSCEDSQTTENGEKQFFYLRGGQQIKGTSRPRRSSDGMIATGRLEAETSQDSTSQRQ